MVSSFASLVDAIPGLSVASRCSDGVASDWVASKEKSNDNYSLSEHTVEKFEHALILLHSPFSVMEFPDSLSGFSSVAG